MTDRLIHALSRQPVTRLVRPLAAFVLSLVIAFGGGLWLTTVRHANGGVAAGQPGFVSHWLRDATLVLPVVMLAVWVGLLVTRRVLARSAAEPSVAIGASLLAMVVGGLTAVGMAAFGLLHAVLFAGEHAGHELPVATQLVRDALIAFPVNLILAGAVAAALARRRPWDAPQVLAWRMPGRGAHRLALQGGLAVMLLAPVVLFAQVGTERAIAGSGPGTPCPAGAPTKSFSVNAINVDIPLNRFGDHDNLGKMFALTSMIPAVRAEEASRHVTAGLRDDPIQPLVVRANMGDCVEISFTNQASGEFGMHIDGLAYDVASSGDAVGKNASSSVGSGSSRLYRYYVPNDAELEGAHYIRPGAGNRNAVSHGLFGVLVVEPEGSRYLSPDTGQDLPFGWGWEATIVPGGGKKAFRESNLLHHEIGDEKFIIPTTSLDSPGSLPVKDPSTTSYRPASRALNYRSEPFMHRLQADALDRLKAYSYNSYTFGDPSTPMPRGYIGDPTKIRLVHAGAELFHVFHLHGGGDRWRANPHSDTSYDYQDTGLNKTPVALSASQRLDSQSIGPGESYNLEIEGGAGGVQQGAGDFLFHCHIAEHYVSGMWSVWRVYDTKQPDFAALPDRTPPPDPVDSTGLIGKTMPDGTTITADNLDQWVQPQLPPAGVPQKAAGDPISMDGAVWNWKRGDGADASATNVYFGEPEDTTGVLTGSPWQTAFPNLKTPADGSFRADPGHPGLLAVDTPHALSADNRPRILFNPVNGRPTYPMLRTHIGQRPPYSPNGHTGAPWLGEIQNKAKSGAVDPWAGRKDGLCPQNSDPTTRDFNIVSIHKKLQVTAKGATDDFGKLFVLAKNKDKVRNGTMPAEPLAIRANVGDCINLTVTSEQDASDPNQPFPMTNLHIHHVQFDPNGSDGATAGMVYGQAFRPYKIDDAQLATAPSDPTHVEVKLPGTLTNSLTDLSKYRVGVWVGVGLGTEALEVRQITEVAPAAGGNVTLTLNEALAQPHAADDWIGTEFLKEIWFPDVVLDNIFWHDHVDGIHNWGHGLVGQLIIEPKGSTYHDPVTGAPVDSGALVDIHTNNPLAPGLVNGSFREFVLWSIDQNPTTDSTLNLKAEPLSDRRAVDPDPSLLYSSYRHGDPYTPIPRAYAGDPFVIRTINVSPGVDTLHIDGNRTFAENRATDAAGNPTASPLSAILYGISERYTLAFQGGAGGPKKVAGDYLYTNGIGRRIEHGAWGLIRVLPERRVADLQPLPGHDIPAGQTDPPQVTGGRPPTASTTGEPCAAGAPQKVFKISAVDVPGAVLGRTLAYVPTADAVAVKGSLKVPEPLVLHVAAGDCVNVEFTNQLLAGRASFHVDKLLRDTRSSGINIGFNPEQTVAPGGAKNYRFFADDAKLGSAIISDYGGDDTGVKGLYGALIVSPAGATFTDPVTGAAKDVGSQVDVNVPGQMGYRDFSLIFSENEPTIGINTMPYPPGVLTPTSINYTTANGRALDAAQFSSLANGDPATPILQAYAGDGMQVHVIGAPGSEQQHVFNLGGHTWAWDQHIARSEQLANQGFGPLTSLDLKVRGGAGSPGDYFYGDLRRPFTDVGMWGLLRVSTPGAGPIRTLQFTSLPTGPVTPATRTPISKLILGSRLSKATIVKSGVAFRLTGPTDTRALRVKLYRVGTKNVLVGTSVIEVIGTKAFNKLSRSAKAKRSRLIVAGNGRIRAIWKPTPKLLKTLRAGRYRLDVQGGAGRTSIDPTVLRAKTRITAPPVVKKALVTNAAGH